MTESNVHLCFECGQKNRIPIGKEAGAKCGGCGAQIYAAKGGSKSSASSTRPAPEVPKKSSGGAAILIVLLLLLAGGVWIGSQSNEVDSGQSSYASAQDAGPGPSLSGGASSATAQSDQGLSASEPELPKFSAPSLPIASRVMKNSRPFYDTAPFEVETPFGDGYYLKLVELGTGEVVLTMLIKGGQKFETEVPLGTYQLRYASGQTWYGEEYLFGPGETAYYAASDIFDFAIEGDYAVGHTLVLKKVLNGNLETRKISPEKF